MSPSRLRPLASPAVALRVAALVLGGAALGTLVNFLHPKGVALAAYVPAVMCSAGATADPLGAFAEQTPIELRSPKDAAVLCGSEDALVADVRDAQAYARGHIAGAVHIPCTGTVADVDRVRLAVAGKKRLVVYGETDEQGERVAHDLQRRLDRPELPIVVIAGGWTAWFNAGLACSSGPCDDCEERTSHDAHPAK